MRDILKEKLAERVLVFDGAMGTELYQRHFFVNTSYDGLCLTAPDVIREIHQAYDRAGADVLTTNSYGANRINLARFGLAENTAEINAAAVRLARASAREGVLVAGSVGPVSLLASEVAEGGNQVVDALAGQVAALAAAGADFILFETLSTLQQLRGALEAVHRQPAPVPYVATFTVDREGTSACGCSLEAFLAEIRRFEHPPTAVGLNCGSGPEATLSALEKLRPLTDLPLIVQPNAGVPKNVEGRMIYMTSPEYLATYACRYVNLGVRGVGGCCGTTAGHIKEIAAAVKPLAKAAATSRMIAAKGEENLLPPPATADKGRFAAKLARGEWLTTVEIVPPKGYDLGPTLAKARTCREAGVDAINIPDGPRASARVSPLITALRIQNEAGIEAILHFCCRDKNLIGMQADLLGCAAAGVNNLLFVTGDPPKHGDYPFASAVFDADSIGMAKIQSRLNRGVDLGGQSIRPPTRALIGVGADPNAIDMKREIRRTREKIEAGAEYIITQPVFAVEPLLRFAEAISGFAVPILAGVWPLASYRNAEFMKNEVPGVVVPDEIMTRMAARATKEEQLAEGVRIAIESVEKIRPVIAGIQVSAPFGNAAIAISVIQATTRGGLAQSRGRDGKQTR